MYYQIFEVKQLIIVILFFSSVIVFSNNISPITIVDDSLSFTEFASVYTDTINTEKQEVRYFTRKRFIAIALVVLTGPLGGHRIYLGSHPVVPVFYALTLGGGFVVLPVIDLISIIFTKDLSRFENNERVIMWLNADKEEEKWD